MQVLKQKNNNNVRENAGQLKLGRLTRWLPLCVSKQLLHRASKGDPAQVNKRVSSEVSCKKKGERTKQKLKEDQGGRNVWGGL